MTDSEDSLDFVEQALTSMRDVPVPEGPSAHVLEVTAARLRSLEARGHAHPKISERAVRSRFSWYGGLAAACAVGIAAITWIGLIDHSAAFAFDEAQAKVNEVRSVSYTETRLVTENPVENNDPRVRKVLSDTENPRRHLILDRYLERTEVLDTKGQIQSVDINNAKTGKFVKMFPKEKRFVRFGDQVTMDIDGKNVTESRINPVPTADFYTAIREVPAEATKRLPAKRLGDKQVVGFYWEQKIDKEKGQDTWKRTYWIDTRTKLPVRVEISHRSTDSRVGPSDWVQRDFVFGADLDESLFSTEPPEGYTDETQKIHGISESVTAVNPVGYTLDHCSTFPSPGTAGFRFDDGFCEAQRFTSAQYGPYHPPSSILAIAARRRHSAYGRKIGYIRGVATPTPAPSRTLTARRNNEEFHVQTADGVIDRGPRILQRVGPAADAQVR